MLRYGADGRAVAGSPPEPRLRIREPVPDAWLDVRRTWALVRALLEDASVEVQWLFIDQPLGQLLLREAAASSADPALVARAAVLLHAPTDSQAHDDHMHVRVYCDVADRPFGCVDRGPQRWWKKHWKYMGATAEGSLARAHAADASDASGVRDGNRR
jgi:penicillin-insensitive murein endopeptidase